MKRNTIPKSLLFEVWTRDNWVCRYCNEPVIFAPTLKILDSLSPKHGYYHAHGDENYMIPRFARAWASVDHVVPFSKGGEDTKDNLVTACWRCNNTISNQTESEGKPKLKPINKITAKTDWDGMASLYLKLSDSKDEWTELIKKII